jgi:hypothetical protein
MAERQREQAGLLAMRLKAQAKGEIDALRRALREGRLTAPQWRKVAAIGFARKAGGNGGEAAERSGEATAGRAGSEAEFASIQSGEHASRNALICVEPWRCRLPVVQTNGSGAHAS